MHVVYFFFPCHALGPTVYCVDQIRSRMSEDLHIEWWDFLTAYVQDGARLDISMNGF